MIRALIENRLWLLALHILFLPLASPAYACQRFWEPVILHGADLGSFVGQREDNLEILTLRDGNLTPVPFQADAVLANGEFALPYGPHPISSDHPGTLGPKDEIVMMLCDLGERVVNRGLLPPQSLEVEVSNPLGGANLYAYVATSDSPRRSLDKYVTYDAHLQTVTTDGYRFRMKNELPRSFALAQGRNGFDGDLAQGFEARGDARLLNLIPIHFTERDVRAELLAYETGPVRTIRNVRHWMSLGLGFNSPTVVRTEFFYRRSVDERATIKLPWLPSALFGGITVRVDAVLQDMAGLTFSWSDMQGSPLSPDDAAWSAIMLEAPVAEWLMLVTRWGALFGAFMPTGAGGELTPRLYYEREPSGKDDPQPSSRPRIGYSLTGWQKLSKGPHPIDFIVIQAPPQYAGATVWRQLRASPTVRVHPMSLMRSR